MQKFEGAAKINQVIYLSSSKSSPRFKALAQIVFEIYLADKISLSLILPQTTEHQQRRAPGRKLREPMMD